MLVRLLCLLVLALLASIMLIAGIPDFAIGPLGGLVALLILWIGEIHTFQGRGK